MIVGACWAGQKCRSLLAVGGLVADGWVEIDVLAFLFLHMIGEHVNCELIGGHHDGSVGNLSDELGAKAPVPTPQTLLGPY